MNKLIVLLFLFVSLLFTLCLRAQTVNHCGVEYRILGNNEVEVYRITKKLRFLDIPSSFVKKDVTYTVLGIGGNSKQKGDKRDELTVVNLPEGICYVGDQSFMECNNLKKITFPSTLKYIGNQAFYNCSRLEAIVVPNAVDTIGSWAFFNCYNLEKVVLPAKMPTIKPLYNQVRRAVFCGCDNLTELSSDNMPFVSYVFRNKELWFYGDNYKKIQKLLSNSVFSFFAYDKIVSRMEDWQRKKEYETPTQWRERVSEENRKKQMDRITNDIRREYISINAPQKIVGVLGRFDTDYEIYPVEVEAMDDVFYVHVPLEEAQYFKENWENVVILPEYGIINDQLGILSCKYMLGDKFYNSVRNVTNDGINDMQIDLPPLEINFAEIDDGKMLEEKGYVEKNFVQVDRSIDTNIPVTSSENSGTFAVIIGNENYHRVSHVDYALNDAKVFSEYCQKTLGIPKRNIREYKDATYGVMMTALDDIYQISKAYNGNINVIFYYAGHGIPDESTMNAFLLPVDVDGSRTNLCLSVNSLYRRLYDLKSRQVIVFMDACFSGSQRGEGMLASTRGVALKVKNNVPMGNMVVFSAATGDQTAFPFNEKGHGMFTYFLLKKLRDTRGEVTLGDLGRYIVENVRQQSIIVNHRIQEPTILPANTLGEEWVNMKLK